MQLFNSRHQHQTKRIAKRVLNMQKEIGRSFENFNSEQKVKAFENINSPEYSESDSDDSIKHRIQHIIEKKFALKKVETSDQAERDIEVGRLVSQLTATQQLLHLKRQNQLVFDPIKYNRELLNMHIKLGYVNPQQLQAQKLKMLAKEINDSRSKRIKDKIIKKQVKLSQNYHYLDQ